MLRIPRIACRRGGPGRGLLRAGSARPEEPGSHVGKRLQMRNLDRNRDGFLTRDELDPDHRLALEFATYDTVGDGRISDAEFFDYVEQSSD